jgi:hypothetical protein
VRCSSPLGVLVGALEGMILLREATSLQEMISTPMTLLTVIVRPIRAMAEVTGVAVTVEGTRQFDCLFRNARCPHESHALPGKHQI